MWWRSSLRPASYTLAKLPSDSYRQTVASPCVYGWVGAGVLSDDGTTYASTLPRYATHQDVDVVLLVEGDAPLKVVVRDIVGGGLPELRHVVRNHRGVLADGLDPQRLVPVLL